jgi:hypothetical protein
MREAQPKMFVKMQGTAVLLPVSIRKCTVQHCNVSIKRSIADVVSDF